MPSYTTVYNNPNARGLIAAASTTLVALLMASQAWASGFQLQEQNVTNLGTAYAGTAALAADASTAYYNPAGITRIKDHQLVVAGVLVHADNDFNPTFVTTMSGAVVPSRGEEESDKDIFIPSLHYTAEITDNVYLGLSVAAPFGLSAEYSENSVLRYMATRSELRTLDISPSLAYRFNNCWSVAVGLDAVWAKAHLDLQTSFPITVPVPTLSDGFQRNTAEDWGYGYHLALLWEMSERTRFGVNYRSHVNIHAEGESEGMVPSHPLVAISGVRTTYPIHSDVTLPATLYVSAYHAFTDEFAMMADVNWTDWSRFSTLRLRYDAPSSLAAQAAGIARIPTDTFERWDDTVRVALGMEYTPCEKYKFRFGVAWDQSPVDTEFRTARIPDADRLWVGIGAGFALSHNIWVDLGYAHLFFKDANIDETSPFLAQTTTPSTAAVLRGKFNTNVDILGLQFRWTFS